MPPVPKLEEFRAPWETEAGEDAEIDKGKLKKYIHGLLVDKDKAQTDRDKFKGERDTLKQEKDEAAREGETETDRLKRELAEAKAEGSKENPEVLKLRVALRKKLTEVQAKRLVGTTEEELEADADELVASFGGAGQADDDEEGGTTARRQPRGATTGTDPEPDADKPFDIDKAIESIPRIN